MRYGENILKDETNHTIIRSFHSTHEPRNIEFTAHHHTECELSLFVKGRGVYSVKDKRYDFEPGDIFLFGSNEAHCITEIHESMHLINVHFEPRLLWHTPECADLINLFAARNKNFSNKFSNNEVLKSKILELECELSSKKDCYGVMTKYALFSALTYILRCYDYIDNEKIITSPSSSIKSLQSAIQYINEGLSGKLTLEDISAVACMTPTYFSSVFKKYNGISPWEYITIKRVELAIEMLKTTDISKLRIAELCGFSSSSNFYKAFAAVTGKKPSDYKIK